MSCTNLLAGYHDIGQKTESGKRKIQILSNVAYRDEMLSIRPMGRTYIPIPCGNCKACRISKSREWALRCMHEASLYTENIFITLTFNDKHINRTGTLHKPDFQNFMKRLRKRFVSKQPLLETKQEEKQWNLDNQIRYYHCGEYGSKFQRPHHHACIFNLKLSDKIPWKKDLYTSKTIHDLWTHPKTGESLGFHTVGTVNYDTAAYCARYITKKINGKAAPDHYQGRQPEYTTMSRRPGIGGHWYDKFGQDIHEKDEIAFLKDGRINTVKPPKYYDKILERVNPERYEIIQQERKTYRELHPSTAEQRSIQSQINDIKYKKYKRTYEDET